MKSDENESRIALQPETAVEQALLSELFARLTEITDAPSHPEKIGNTLVFYTPDVGEYGGLDHDLWESAELRVNEHGMLDPEAGSRALVVVHTPEAAEESDENDEENPDLEAEDDAEDEDQDEE